MLSRGGNNKKKEQQAKHHADATPLCPCIFSQHLLSLFSFGRQVLLYIISAVFVWMLTFFVVLLHFAKICPPLLYTRRPPPYTLPMSIINVLRLRFGKFTDLMFTCTFCGTEIAHNKLRAGGWTIGPCLNRIDGGNHHLWVYCPQCAEEHELVTAFDCPGCAK